MSILHHQLVARRRIAGGATWTANNTLLSTYDNKMVLGLKHSNGALLTDIAGHTFTNNNAVSNDATGIDGYCALYDGSSNYLSTPDSPDWDFFGDGTDSAIVIWVKMVDHAGVEILMSQVEGAVQDFFDFAHVHGSGLRFRLYTGNVEQISLIGGEITDSDYHLAVLTKFGNDYKIWLDNVNTASVTDGSQDTYSAVLVLGGRVAGSAAWFNGREDEVNAYRNMNFADAQAVEDFVGALWNNGTGAFLI